MVPGVWSTSHTAEHCNGENGTRPVEYAEVRTISFYLCRSDAECARRFFIDHRALDYSRYMYLFDRFVAETESRQFLIAHFSVDAVKQGWLYTMRRANFCTENEVLDSEGYCVCRNGKVCHETSGDVFSFDILSLDFLCIVVIVGVFYYSTLHMSQFRVMYHNVMRLRDRYEREDSAAAALHAKQTRDRESAYSATAAKLATYGEIAGAAGKQEATGTQ